MNQTKQSSPEGTLYVTLMLWVFPLFLWTDYSDITTMKMIAYLVLLAGFTAASVMTWLENRKRLAAAPAAKWWQAENLPDLFLLLFLLSGTVSWLASPYFGQKNGDGLDLILFGAGRFDGLLFIASYGLVYFLCSRNGNLRLVHIKGFSVVLTVMCAIAAVQLSGINVMHLYPTSLYRGTFDNFLSTIGNVDVFGGFLCMTLPLIGVGYVVFRLSRGFRLLFLFAHTLAVYVMLSMEVDMTLVTLLALAAVMTPLLLRNRRYALKTLEIGMSLVLGAGLSTVVTYTYVKADRQTLTGFAFGKPALAAVLLLAVLLGLWWLLCRCRGGNIRWHYVRWGVVGLEGLALIAGFCFFRFLYEPSATSGLMYDLYELVRGSLSDTAGHHRIGIWRNSLTMAKEHLWLGTGTGTYATSFKAFAAEVGYSRYANRNLDFAHNEYVHYICTLGLSGLVCYLGFLGTAAFNTLRLLGKNPRLLVLGAAVFGYCVWVFFCFSVVIITPIFWMLLGLLVREVRLTLHPPREESAPSATGRSGDASEGA